MSNSWRFITTIAKKEIIEFVRDWRTLLALVVIPLLIFPALFIALPLLLESEAAELDSLELNIIWQGDVNDELQLAFNNSSLMNFSTLIQQISAILPKSLTKTR